MYLFIFNMHSLVNIQQHCHYSSHCDWQHHIIIILLLFTCIYNARTFTSGTESEALNILQGCRDVIAT